MDDTHGGELFAPTHEEMFFTALDLQIGEEFDDKLGQLCQLVVSGIFDRDGSSTEEHDPDKGERILALALIAVADLPPRRGRAVSAKEAVGTLTEGHVPWFFVGRRLDLEGRTRVRISVPWSRLSVEWLAEFDGDVLTALDPTTNE